MSRINAHVQDPSHPAFPASVMSGGPRSYPPAHSASGQPESGPASVQTLANCGQRAGRRLSWHRSQAAEWRHGKGRAGSATLLGARKDHD